MKIPEPSEHQIQTAILNYLAYKGYYAMRLNSGKIPMAGKYGTRMIQMLPPGTPDIMAFKKIGQYPKGQVELLFIEVKKRGNKPTILQEAKMKELEEYGAECIIATSIEDVEKELEANG